MAAVVVHALDFTWDREPALPRAAWPAALSGHGSAGLGRLSTTTGLSPHRLWSGARPPGSAPLLPSARPGPRHPALRPPPRPASSLLRPPPSPAPPESTLVARGRCAEPATGNGRRAILRAPFSCVPPARPGRLRCPDGATLPATDGAARDEPSPRRRHARPGGACKSKLALAAAPPTKPRLLTAPPRPGARPGLPALPAVAAAAQAPSRAGSCDASSARPSRVPPGGSTPHLAARSSPAQFWRI